MVFIDTFGIPPARGLRPPADTTCQQPGLLIAVGKKDFI
jgi:hypothetical protein